MRNAIKSPCFAKMQMFSNFLVGENANKGDVCEIKFRIQEFENCEFRIGKC